MANEQMFKAIEHARKAAVYDAIVMNPPFSNGDEHLLKAWNFLHAGEIVCLLNEETIKNSYSATRIA